MDDFSQDRDFSTGIGVSTSMRSKSILLASAVAAQTQSDNAAIAHGLKRQNPELLDHLIELYQHRDRKSVV